MITIVWRGSGILVLIYFFLSAWLCTYFIDGSHNLNNSAYAGWTLFWAAIAATLHAAMIGITWYGAKAEPEQTVPAEPGQEPETPPSLFRSHLFYIPVIFWPLIFGLLSAKFLMGNDAPHSSVTTAPDDARVEQQKVDLSRTIHFLNTSEDTLMYEISGTNGAFEVDHISPRTYISKTLDPGKYIIRTGDREGDVVFTFPSDDIANDKTKCAVAKDRKGKNAAHRVIGDATESKDDYDDIWVVLNGERDMMLVEVTEICHASMTTGEIDKMDWTKLTHAYNGTDIIEPLYGEDPGTGIYTVLATGDDIPTSLTKNERVFALFSFPRGTELTNEYLIERIVSRCPELSEN